MEIKTYDTLLTELCNTFDEYITPKKITRSNTNIVYLILKAFAKGLEVINNVVVSLSSKFDPATCSEEDLDSIAKLVGTERLHGSSTGLQITVENKYEVSPVTLPAGVYVYELDADTLFKFTVNQDVSLEPEGTTMFIAMSAQRKSIPVTEQPNITVVREDGIAISEDLVFSCTDNAGLLGTQEESTLEFRQRIVQGSTTSSMIDKMQSEIRQLPYIFDCQVFFNNSSDVVVKGDVSVNPWTLLVVVSGNPDAEVARIVAKYSVFPTVITDNYVSFETDVFADGEFRVYYKDFDSYPYDLNILYKADSSVISDLTVQTKFNEALKAFKNKNIYTPLLTEQTFANLLMELGLSSVQILNVDIYDTVRAATVDYVEVPITYIARLRNANITRSNS